MNNITELIKKLSRDAGLVKTSMALNPGEVDYGNRRGLRWHRFLPGQFQGSDSLPEEASSTIEKMINSFKDKFSQFRLNPKTQEVLTKYRGMIFAIYANDSAVNDSTMKGLPPELSETADFVKKNHVRMILNGTDKSIGTPFWISYNAHAYLELFPNNIKDVGKMSPESIIPVKSEKQISNMMDRARKKAIDAGAQPHEAEKIAESKVLWGDVIVDETTNGFGLFLNTKKGMEPVLRGQTASNTEKFFVDNLRMGASLVSMPEGTQGKIESARRINLSKSDLNNEKRLNERSRRLDIYNNARANETAYTLNSDSEGGIYATNVATDATHYLSQQQVTSIVLPEQLSKPFLIKPQKGEPVSSIREGQWQMDEELRNHLETTDSPIGFQSLRALRDHADSAHTEQHGSSMHAPYEGFKIIMIGPVFSNASNLGEGRTTSRPGFATHITSPEDSLVEGDEIEVNRDVKWVVIANEVRPNMQDKMNPWTNVKGKGDRSDPFKTPQEAVSYVMSNYIDADVKGNASVLSSASESLVEADKALKAAAGSSAGAMSQLPANQPKLPVSPPVVEQPQQSPIQNLTQQVDPNLGRMASNSLRNILGRIKR